MQADTDTLKSMFDVLWRTYRLADDGLSTLHPLGQNMDLSGVMAILLDPAQKPVFEGVALCVHCVNRAAMLFRDLANTCEDLVKEAEKHGKPIQ